MLSFSIEKINFLYKICSHLEINSYICASYLKKLIVMKLDRLSYLELVVHHVYASFCDYPSRCCYIRIPLEKIDFKRPSVCVPIDFSLGQIKKLNSIGFFTDPKLYLVVGHRPFDKKLIDWQFPDFDNKFRDACIKSYNCYSHYLDFIGSNYFEKKEF